MPHKINNFVAGLKLRIDEVVCKGHDGLLSAKQFVDKAGLGAFFPLRFFQVEVLHVELEPAKQDLVSQNFKRRVCQLEFEGHKTGIREGGLRMDLTDHLKVVESFLDFGNEAVVETSGVNGNV